MDGDENVDPVADMLAEGGTGTPPATVDYQKLYEQMQQQNAQIMQQNTQLAQTVQQVAARPVIQQSNTPAPDPFAAFNPETAAALKQALDQQAAQFKQQLATTQQQFAGMALEQEAASIAVTPGLTPDQIKRAQDIFRGNRSKGIPINAAECIDVVLGADFRAGKINLGQRGAPPVINGGSRTPAPAKARPANFEKMSLKQQIVHYESDENLHNEPIKGIWDDAD